MGDLQSSNLDELLEQTNSLDQVWLIANLCDHPILDLREQSHMTSHDSHVTSHDYHMIIILYNAAMSHMTSHDYHMTIHNATMSYLLKSHDLQIVASHKSHDSHMTDLIKSSD